MTCFKGVNVIPDIFKYIVVIQFELGEGQDDMFAMDCIQVTKLTIFQAAFVSTLVSYSIPLVLSGAPHFSSGSGATSLA